MVKIHISRGTIGTALTLGATLIYAATQIFPGASRSIDGVLKGLSGANSNLECRLSSVSESYSAKLAQQSGWIQPGIEDLELDPANVTIHKSADIYSSTGHSETNPQVLLRGQFGRYDEAASIAAFRSGLEYMGNATFWCRDTLYTVKLVLDGEWGVPEAGQNYRVTFAGKEDKFSEKLAKQPVPVGAE